jgi:nucleotide-binding universal stress UspA family protein
MFHKAVLAPDGSDVSRKAADLAEAIAQRVHSEVLVVHVGEFTYTGGSTLGARVGPELEAFMAELVTRLTAEDRRARSGIIEAVEGHELHAIADAAATMGADLMVMCIRGRSELAGAILGSAAGSVVNHASWPILVARVADRRGRRSS